MSVPLYPMSQVQTDAPLGLTLFAMQFVQVVTVFASPLNDPAGQLSQESPDRLWPGPQTRKQDPDAAIQTKSLRQVQEGDPLGLPLFAGQLVQLAAALVSPLN